MLTPDSPTTCGLLAREFSAVDAELTALEQRITADLALPLADTVARSIALVRQLVAAYIADAGEKPVPDVSVDILEVFKLLVKGDPSWTAIRDNCRELVYYRNCINMEREDALPAAPAKMAVRTARHVYLYIRTRCVREGRLES